MGRLENKTIIGAVGAVTFSRWRGKTVVKKRVMKGDIRQTDATKNASTVFGLASSFGANLRDKMRPIHFIQDGTAANRMNKETLAILRRYRDAATGDFHFPPDAFRPLEGFELNAKSPMQENCWAMPEVSLKAGKLLVRMPEFVVKKALKFPREADSCTIIISVYIASLKTEDDCLMNDDMIKTFDIQRNDTLLSAQEWTFDVPEGCFCVTSMALHFHEQWSNLQVSLNNKSFSPAMICDFSINPGEFKNKPKKWMPTGFSFEDGKNPPIKKKTKNKQIPSTVNLDQEHTKTEKKKAAKKKIPNTKHNHDTPATSLALQDQLLRYLELQQQQNEALHQQVAELQVQLAAIKKFVSDSKTSIMPAEAQNVAFTAAAQAKLLNISKRATCSITQATNSTTSLPQVPTKLSGSFNHKNRGKPAA